MNLLRNALTLSVLLLPMAQASLVPVFVGQSGTTFTYNIDFTTATDTSTGQPAERLQSGNFLTLYDIPGATVTATSPAPWTSSVQTVGVTPAGTAPTDSTLLNNVTFTYGGPTITADTSFTNFTINASGANGIAACTLCFTSTTVKNTGDSVGTQIGHIGDTMRPASGVPEPTTVALVGSALIGAGLLRRRKYSA